MKTAIYQDAGIVQVVLTPETDFEKMALSKIGDNIVKARIYSGGFYACNGGWTRQVKLSNTSGLEDDSLIIKLAKDDNEK